MRIFTKSLLTLALLLVANGVSAQAVWQKIFSQGWVHEWRTDDKQTDSAIEPDAEGVYKVYCRSAEQAEAAGNATKDNNGNFADWDSQFFITWGEEYALKEGDKFKVSFKYRADNEGSGVSTQAHGAPGAYNHYEMIGNFDFTDEWQEFESGEKTISADQGKNNGCWTIAFNLAKGAENTFYFKDIVVEVFAEKRPTKTVVSENMDWKELIVNGDMEGTDVSSFWWRFWPYENGDPAVPAEITDGVGVDGSRGIKMAATDKGKNPWDNQFWVLLSETPIPAGTSYRVKFDYRADEDAGADTQTHDTPSDYVYYDWLGKVNFTTDWQTLEKSGTVSAAQAANDNGFKFRSFAFNLNDDSHPEANNYYFDNVSFQIGALLNDVRHNEEGIQVLFTDWTNMPDLIIESANGKSRLYGLNDCVKVTVNDEQALIASVEYDRNGKFYIFPDEDWAAEHELNEAAKVIVSFTNPEAEKYRLLYTNGDKTGEAVEDFEMESKYDGDVEIMSFSNTPPEIETTEPENGSFNLPATISEFKVVFDKAVKIQTSEHGKLQARLDGKEDLTVEAATEFPTEITLKRTGKDALAEGEHTIIINNVFRKNDVQEVENPDHTLTFSVGTPAMHPDLQYALESAIKVRDDNEDERYGGEAYDALKAAIEKYEAEGVNYTAPSVVKEAVRDLGLKTQNMEKHRKNCDDYDTNLASAVELVAQYGEGKFANTELYQVLKEAVGKYEGKVLTNDEELAAAVADLKNNVAAGQQMFTEGVSKNGDAGIKVLVDRIRRGAEALQNSFEAAEDDELVVAANNALTDDDALANQIKDRIKLEVYKKLKDGDDSMFSSDVDEDGNEILSGPDLSVFVKNPNVYAKDGSHKGFSEENIPGWTSTANIDLWTTWGSKRGVDGLPEDCAFTTWYGSMRMEQTITDLPAGVYNITIYGSEWLNNGGGDEPKEINSFVYAKTSDTPALEEGEEEDRDVHFAATMTCTFAGANSMDGAHTLTDLTVTDGKLTFGINLMGDSQYFYGDVKLTLVGAAPGFDYAGAVDGIKDMKQNTSKSSVYYDLQGRRIAKPAKGIYINNNKKVVVK